MQKIEFYQASFRPVKITLPLSQMLSIIVATMIILAVVAGYQYWMLEKLQKEYATISALDKKQQDVVAQMTQSISQMKVSPALAAQADTLKESIANQERLLAILRKQSDTHKVSFSAFLQSLMDYHQEGIALQGVGIAEAGILLTLEGVATDAALLPRYLEGLKQADVLQGVGFSVFEVTREERDAKVHFQISSRGEGSEETP